MVKESTNSECDKKPIKILNIIQEGYSVFDKFKKIGQVKFLNMNGDKDIKAISQFQIGIDELDYLDSNSFEISINAILFALRSIAHDFSNSEPHADQGTVYKKQYRAEILKISDELLYIDTLNSNTRINQYEY